MATKENARYNAANMKYLTDKMFADMYAKKGTEITFFGDTKAMEERAKKLGLCPK